MTRLELHLYNRLILLPLRPSVFIVSVSGSLYAHCFRNEALSSLVLVVCIACITIKYKYDARLVVSIFQLLSDLHTERGDESRKCAFANSSSRVDETR